MNRRLVQLVWPLLQPQTAGRGSSQPQWPWVLDERWWKMDGCICCAHKKEKKHFCGLISAGKHVLYLYFFFLLQQQHGNLDFFSEPLRTIKNHHGAADEFLPSMGQEFSALARWNFSNIEFLHHWKTKVSFFITPEARCVHAILLFANVSLSPQPIGWPTGCWCLLPGADVPHYPILDLALALFSQWLKLWCDGEMQKLFSHLSLFQSPIHCYHAKRFIHSFIPLNLCQLYTQLFSCLK